ncbi:uncharacterized protein [Anabrus simplex]|uniref:uncharacterized protein n=1 Tax=Anabrus simplex TaxID=316456 RepID=UPI0035A285CF
MPKKGNVARRKKRRFAGNRFTNKERALGFLSAMEQDTSLGSDDDIKQDIPQNPFRDVECVCVPEGKPVSLCAPKVEVFTQDPLRDVEGVYVSEEKPVSLYTPKVEDSSES